MTRCGTKSQESSLLIVVNSKNRKGDVNLLNTSNNNDAPHVLTGTYSYFNEELVR